jgi:Lanthionine synthetase C-like protein
LNALLIVYREIPDDGLRALADTLAEDLLASARTDGGWATLPKLCLAHGRAAAAHALLGWSLALRRELPAWFHDELVRLSSDIDREGRMGAPAGMDALTAAWCNGAAGLVLLWARAYEATGDAAHRRRAQAAARYVAKKTRGPGDLCCGLAGSSFALLAMDRIEPDRGWDARALKMAALAVDKMVERTNEFPNGLFGFPGIICLARDLASPRAKRLGFPLVEG